MVMVDKTSFTPLQVTKLASGQLLTPKDLAAYILNMYENSEGLMESMPSPVPFLPEYWETFPLDELVTPEHFNAGGGYLSVFHAILPNNRDCLLVHGFDGIYLFQGAFQAWRQIFSLATTDNATYYSTRYSTQWILTTNGIVIVPAGNRPLFFNGEVADYLGYNNIPGAPTGIGPTSSHGTDYLWPNAEVPNTGDAPVEQSYDLNNSYATVNNGGYFIHAMYNFAGALEPNLGVCRLGTTTSPDGLSSGQGKLLNGEYRAKVQYIDRFGNMSPVSGASNAVTWVQQYSWIGNLTYSAPDFVRSTATPSDAERVKQQVLWNYIPIGDDKTIGRILYRSKDLKNSGDLGFYEVPGNAQATASSFATIPDNMCKMFPDNVPDSWLVRPEPNYTVTPAFRYAAMAFGRLWIANWDGGTGTIRPSVVGLWGTFEAGKDIIPDTRGFEVTGLHASSKGLLVFTSNSTFLVYQNDQTSDYNVATISSTIGCIGSDTIQTLNDGSVVWLAFDGFYRFNPDKGIQKVSDEIDLYFESINRGTIHRSVSVYDAINNEYTCFVPFKSGFYPNTGFIYTGKGWRFHAPMSDYPNISGGLNNYLARIDAVCMTRDHRNYMICIGTKANADINVYVLNVGYNTPLPIEYTTTWLGLGDPGTRSLTSVYLLLRETKYSREYRSDEYTQAVLDLPLTLKVYRNYDEDVSDQAVTALVDYKQLKSYWNVTVLPEDDAAVVFNRPKMFWAKIDVNVPESEVFRIRLTTTAMLEILGFAFNAIPNAADLSNLPTVGVQVVT